MNWDEPFENVVLAPRLRENLHIQGFVERFIGFNGFVVALWIMSNDCSAFSCTFPKTDLNRVRRRITTLGTVVYITYYSLGRGSSGFPVTRRNGRMFTFFNDISPAGSP